MDSYIGTHHTSGMAVSTHSGNSHARCQWLTKINKEIIFGNLSLSIEYVMSHQDVLFYVM